MYVNIKSDHDFLLQSIWSSTCPYTEQLQERSFDSLKGYQPKFKEMFNEFSKH